MLISLYIENYALIDKLTIEFAEGFNVLTGETGAGKSIIVGALGMILGERSSIDLIKSGAQRAVLEAVFDIRGRKIKDYENDEVLIITRELQLNGRNICKINGRIITQAALKDTSKYLLDIHGQHQHQVLIDQENHLGILDLFVDFEPRRRTRETYEDYTQAKKEYELLLHSKELKQEEKDYLKYQLEELTAARIIKGEYKELEDEKSRLDNYTEIAEAMKTIDQSAYNVLDNLQRNRAVLQKVSAKENALQDLTAQAESLEIGFEEFKNNIKEYEAGLEYNPNRLEEINERLDLYNNLKRKHLKKAAEDVEIGELLLAKQKEITEILNSIEFSEEKLKELTRKFQEKEKIYLTEAGELSKSRKKVAQDLEKKIVNSLKELKMNSVDFKVFFKQRSEYSVSGIDEIEFLISPNPGEPLKPMAKIASGGEISRIMLAIKDILLDKDMVAAMIFDEIDTGIGGDTANAIAAKIATIAGKHQVICVTHLAQIASVADSHYLVKKEVKSGKTLVNVEKLAKADRELEIARMLSGKITDTTKAHAKELLQAK